MPETRDEFNRDILIAVDESDNARRAVAYVGRMVGGLDGFRSLLLHVINEPEEDFFASDQEREKWLAQYRKRIEKRLDEYRVILVDGGFSPEAVSARTVAQHCPSLAQCILAERQASRCKTIVVGRQGLSRSEEFLFGSVSSKIVTRARNCTVWVVE